MIRGQEIKIIKRLSACWSPCMHGEIYIPVDQDKQEAICNPRKMTFLVAFLVSYFRSLWMSSSIKNTPAECNFHFSKMVFISPHNQGCSRLGWAGGKIWFFLGHCGHRPLGLSALVDARWGGYIWPPGHGGHWLDACHNGF